MGTHGAPSSRISLLPRSLNGGSSFKTLRDTMNISKPKNASLAFRQMQIRRRGGAGPRQGISNKARQTDGGKLAMDDISGGSIS